MWETPRRADGSRRPPFGIHAVTVDGVTRDVRESVVAERPFSRLLRFVAVEDTSHRRPAIMLVAPLSGNFAYVMRDTVVGLLPDLDVHLLEWRDAREVPAAAGAFGLDENIADVIHHARNLPEGSHLLGLCQSVVPAFAAAALMCQGDDAGTPSSLTLISGPIDPRIHPSKVETMIRGHTPEWLDANVVSTVADDWPGAGRRVYAADTQRGGLAAYLARHMATGKELRRKMLDDDGADPVEHPFKEHFWSLMDLPAEVFVDTMRVVFHEAALPRGAMNWYGVRVEPAAIERMGLLTIEGREDDIAGVGQTWAAHDITPGLTADMRGRHLQAHAGHFSTFHGAAWRRTLAPMVSGFVAEHRR